MDERFPKWLRWAVRKLDFLGLPNLGMLICGLAGLGFIGRNFMGAPFERFLFDPIAVMQGEWWRLFAFPGAEFDSPIWLLFFILYTYFVMTQLESQWGPGPLTLFTLLSYVAALGASFLVGHPLSVWYYVMQNVSLAFGTMFPNVELYLFFILPIRAKWLALFAGALIAFQFLVGGVATKLVIGITIAPYLLFFGPMLFDWIRYRMRKKKKFDGDMWR